MNFEFLQNLRGMEKIYTPCKDAEDLAITKPYLSMTAARKGAEALALFIYGNAYREKAQSLSFADILADYNVKRYIGDRDVMDAFHNIRKHGNRAVHESIEPSPSESIEILEDLMFVAGETAKKAKLIRGYPRFNASIPAVPDAEFHDFDVKLLADEMLQAYIAKERAESIYAKYNQLCSTFRIMENMVVLHESVEVVCKSDDPSFIPKLQEYFGTLALKAIEEIGVTNDKRTISFTPSLTILGKKNLSTNDLYEFMELLFEEVPLAEHFIIDCCYEGPDSDYLYSGDHLKIAALAAGAVDRPIKTYKLVRFNSSENESNCCLIEGGIITDIDRRISTGILDNDYGENWWNEDMELYIDADIDKRSAIFEELHGIVRKYIPADQIKYCENAWTNGEPNNLLDGIQWNTRQLREVQNFFDELNKLLLPIKDEIECSCVGSWIIPKCAFANATWDWTDDGFRIVGLDF